MKIALICNGGEQLGVQYLSAFLKSQNHNTKLFFDPQLFNDKVVFNFTKIENIFSMRERLVSAVVNWQPELIGISTVTVTYQWAKFVAGKIKEKMPDTLIIIGGSHAILSPDNIIEESCFDVVCIGEGERAISELANSIQNGKIDYTIKDLWFHRNDEIIKNSLRNLLEDVDQLPLPDRSIFEPYINLNESLLTMSLRGCPYNCSYCSHNVIKKKYAGKGKYLRRKSPGKFIDELRELKKCYDFKFIRIYDDIFTYDLDWLEKFAVLYKKHVNLPYFCLGHPKYLDETAIKLISESGCKWIQVGIESFNEKTRKEVLQRNETNDEIISAVNLLEKYKLKYELDFIFGLPGDQEEDYIETVNMLKKTSCLNRVSGLVLSLLPETDIVKYSLVSEEIFPEDIRNIKEGLESSQTDKGSIRNNKSRFLAKQYNLLYRLCAFLSSQEVSFLQRTGLFKLLIYLNPFLIYFIRLLGMDQVDKLFIKEFIRQFIKTTLKRKDYYKY